MMPEFLEEHIPKVVEHLKENDEDYMIEIIGKVLVEKVLTSLFTQEIPIEISKRILDKSIPDNLTAREIYRNGWRGLSNPTGIAHCLEQLENCGWIKGEKANSKTKKTERCRFSCCPL